MNAKPEVSTVLKGDSYRRNMRIKTEDTIMRNEEDAEDAQLAHDNISEMDFLQQNRKSVKRQYYGNRIRIYSRIN